MVTKLDETIYAIRKRDYIFLGKFLGIAAAARDLRDNTASFPLIVDFLCRTYDEYIGLLEVKGGD